MAGMSERRSYQLELLFIVDFFAGFVPLPFDGIIVIVNNVLQVNDYYSGISFRGKDGGDLGCETRRNVHDDSRWG